jgi:hypothetical protein
MYGTKRSGLWMGKEYHGLSETIKIMKIGLVMLLAEVYDKLDCCYLKGTGTNVLTPWVRGMERLPIKC